MAFSKAVFMRLHLNSKRLDFVMLLVPLDINCFLAFMLREFCSLQCLRNCCSLQDTVIGKQVFSVIDTLA